MAVILNRSVLQQVALIRIHATCCSLLFAHVFFAKPLHTFARHALDGIFCAHWVVAFVRSRTARGLSGSEIIRLLAEKCRLNENKFAGISLIWGQRAGEGVG
jgi:hypothetical protein